MDRIVAVLTFILGISGVVHFACAQPLPADPKTGTPPTQSAADPGMVFRDCAQCPEMVMIPKGSFVMGSPASEKDRHMDEGPQHQVTIAYRLAVSKFEITFDEWDACVRAGGCKHKPSDWRWGRGRRPVINISWEDTQQYVRWLSAISGKRYRLLSEAEWEYAARAGTTTARPWGEHIEVNRANCAECGSQWDDRQTAPVGSFPANRFGLHDMIGNVVEWTDDCWNASYGGAPNDGRPWRSGDCRQRVVRGGPWSRIALFARAAHRSAFPIARRDIDVGFRVARTEPDEADALDRNRQIENASWMKIRDSRDPSDFQRYLDAYKNGRYVAVATLARDRLLSDRKKPDGKPNPANVWVPGNMFRDCPECPEMIVVPQGSFTMGSPASEPGRHRDLEGPQRQVTLKHTLAVGKFPITFEEWEACVISEGCRHTPHDSGWGRGARPIINVGWHDAQQYVDWLSKRTGKRYRLLSESEWEYAARAGTTTARPWGNEIGVNQANCDGCGPQGDRRQTTPVGSFPANGFGLHDMLGNVSQWTLDCWRETLRDAPVDGSARIVPQCYEYVIRGGAWLSPVTDVRSAVRFPFTPDSRVNFIGFRVARTQ